MPKLEISHSDINALVGKAIPKEKIADDLLFAKVELDETQGDILHIDAKDVNRPDLWSAEGIAREIAGRYGKKGLPKYTIKKGKMKITIDSKSPVQPIAVAAIARNIKITDAVLSQMIQLQEKLSITFGRNRRELSMGVYDLDKITFPVMYTSRPAESIRFAPLGFTKEMPARQILAEHPKGKEHGHLLAAAREYPLWVDARGAILSMPPVINSNDTGNVTTKTKNVFIEVTGYDMKFLQTALNVLVAQMLDRGAHVESVTMQSKGKRMVTPDLTPKTYAIDSKYITKISGFDASVPQLINLLKAARYDVAAKGARLTLKYPAYRQDIMHPRDVIEDVIISAGYNEIEPTVRPLPTKGSFDDMFLFTERVREVCVGLGLQEIMSFVLTNKQNLLTNMRMPEQQVIELEKPVSQTWSVFRTSITPAILEFFANNRHVEYPQHVFEVGTTVRFNEKTETKTEDRIMLAAGCTASTVNYDQISAWLDAIMRNLRHSYSLKKTMHPSFIPGRCAAVHVNGKEVGLLGEVHPAVLERWGLEKPTLLLEIDLTALHKRSV